MNELLQKHGCQNVFSMPAGLKELMSDITREVLRDQPPRMYDFIANYLSVLLITREHGILAAKILEDLCDCRPTVAEHLVQLGFHGAEADVIAQAVQQEIEGFEPVDGKEKLRETQLLKKIMNKTLLDEDMAAKVCQVTRNAYRDYWYRKKLLQQSLKTEPQEPWEIAAEKTLELYKKTKPSFGELTRATKRIQAAYRGYYVRKKLLKHLKPKTPGPKVELPGPPIDIAASREIDLGGHVNVKIKEDPVIAMFEAHAGAELGLRYNPMTAITAVDDDVFHDDDDDSPRSGDSEDRRGTGGRASRHERIQSFAEEVLGGKNTGDRGGGVSQQRASTPSKSPGEYSRHSRVSSFAREPSPTNLNKKISFAEELLQAPSEIVPVEHVDDVEELADYRTDGDGESAQSVTSDPATADMTDVEEIDEAFDTPRDEE